MARSPWPSFLAASVATRRTADSAANAWTLVRQRRAMGRWRSTTRQNSHQGIRRGKASPISLRNAMESLAKQHCPRHCVRLWATRRPGTRVDMKVETHDAMDLETPWNGWVTLDLPRGARSDVDTNQQRMPRYGQIGPRQSAPTHLAQPLLVRQERRTDV